MSDLFKPKNQKELEELLDGKEIIEDTKGRIYPVRVVVGTDGYAVHWGKAEEEYGIIPDIAFMRDDGWTLGAPFEYEDIAYIMWSSSWVNFILAEDGKWRDISEYKF